MTEPLSKIRLDKWLWHARFFKTRSLASSVCKAGKVRLNGQHIRKASVTVTPGDVLTFPRADRILIIEVVALGERRGPATEAQILFKDLTPPEVKGAPPVKAAVGLRDKGSGRPTKAERRAYDKLIGDIE